MSTSDQPSEEDLRAAYEAEIKKIRIEQILLEQVVSLINLGMRRTGLAPGTDDERDLDQVRVAIEAVRALLALIEQTAPAQAGQIRDALSQLQMAFVQLGGGPGAPGGPEQPMASAPDSGTRAPQQAAEPSEPPAPPGAGPVPAPEGPGQPGAEEPKAGDAGPAQRSGRLWVPGSSAD